jgi:hypothetical protein
LIKAISFKSRLRSATGLRASGKTDREFWLGMARRWERMLEPEERCTLKVEVEPGFERPIMKKRANRWVRRQAA